MDDNNQGDPPHGINKECEPLNHSVIRDVRETCATDPIPPQNAPISPTTEERLHDLEEKYEALVEICKKMPRPMTDGIRINITKRPRHTKKKTAYNTFKVSDKTTTTEY